jgi:hypothetical protein
MPRLLSLSFRRGSRRVRSQATDAAVNSITISAMALFRRKFRLTACATTGG